MLLMPQWEASGDCRSIVQMLIRLRFINWTESYGFPIIMIVRELINWITLISE